MPEPKRLTHDHDALLFSLQMSRTSVFVFVEGIKRDRYVYGHICAAVERETPFSHEMIFAGEIGGGGKGALLEFHDFLERRNSLLSTFRGKTTAVLLYLDKDVDDLRQAARQSEHIVYTKHYDIENHIFLYGDLVEGAASAASVDAQTLVSRLSNARDWCFSAAKRWKSWVAVCLLSCREQRGGGYASCSKVNTPPNAEEDAQRLEEVLQELRTEFGWSQADFDARYGSALAEVDGYYRRGEQDVVFKGKWYTYLLSGDLREWAGKRGCDSNGLETRLYCTIAQTLNFDEPWAEHFKAPLRRIVQRVADAGNSAEATSEGQCSLPAA